MNLLTKLFPSSIRILLLVTILIASFLRLWQLDNLPPGLFYDEAFNGVDARGVIEGTSRPIFFHGNNGREALFIYLQSIAVLLLGYKAYALRVVSAFAGITTVPVIFLLARTLQLGGEPAPASHGQRAGSRHSLVLWSALLAAACISVSYWHVSVSRLGFRAILLPLFSALAFVYFWRAWKLRNRRDFLLAGFWLGICLYTYASARLLPFVLVAFVVVELVIFIAAKRGRHLRDGVERLRQRALGLAWLSITVFLIAVPFLYEVYQHPYLINARTEDVSIFTVSEQELPGAPLERLAGNIAVVARSFYDIGDGNPRHNLPGRPINDLLLAALFTIGIAVMLLGIRQAQMRLLAIWLFVMVLPTVLSVEAPHTLRAMGILPPVAMLYGLGGVGIARLLKNRVSIERLGAILVVAILLVSGALTFVDYFVKWARLPILGYAFDLQHELAAEEVARMLKQSPDSPILISRQLYLTPQMRFAIGALAPDGYKAASIPDETLAGGKFLFEDAPDDPNQAVLLLWSPGGVRNATWLEPTLPDKGKSVMDIVRKQTAPVMVTSPIQQADWPSVVTGPLTPVELATKILRNPLNVIFANGLNLVGYEIRPDRIDPGAEIPYFFLTLYWRDLSGKDRSPGEQFDLFTHLRFGNGQSEDNKYFGSGYGISLWLPEEIVDTRRLLNVPSDAAQGKGYIEVGLYDPSPSGSGERVPIVDGNGQAAGTSVSFGGVMIGLSPPQPDTTDLVPVAVTFEQRVQLIGWDLRRKPNDGNTLEVDLAWQTIDRPITDYVAFAHLVDSAGNIVAQYDQPPGGVENPTRLWVPGEIVRATFPLAVDADLSLDSLRLRTGLYEPVGGRQLTITECNLSDEQCVGTFALLSLADLDKP